MPHRPILCIRPEPGLSGTIARGAEQGLTIIGIPLFEIEPLEWMLPEDEDFDGVLLGSANAIRHGGDQLKHLSHLPVYAVGETTAKLAQEAGFTVALAGKGGLQALLDTLPARPIRLLRLAGQDNVPLSPASWQKIVDRVVYRSSARSAPDQLKARLAEGAIVLLHSARAAEHFTNECNRMGVDRSGIALAVLGTRIAEAAKGGWNEVAVAPAPTDAALLAMIQKMCK